MLGLIELQAHNNKFANRRLIDANWAPEADHWLVDGEAAYIRVEGLPGGAFYASLNRLGNGFTPVYCREQATGFGSHLYAEIYAERWKSLLPVDAVLLVEIKAGQAVETVFA